jgi:hypothetical protein
MKRRSRWRRSYVPLTHGYLYLDKDNLRLQLRAYLNWWVTPYLFSSLGLAILSDGFRVVIVASFIFLVLICLAEVAQYRKIWNAAKGYVSGGHSLA